MESNDYQNEQACNSSQLRAWFDAQQNETEVAYLSSKNSYQQSGWKSTPERWQFARKLILKAVNKSGTFLDLGCANGLLLECLMQWAGEQGFYLTPYGVDISLRLVELARRRLPVFATNLVVANAFTFQTPMQYDFVHTLLEYVPENLHLEYLRRLLEQLVAPAGRLIISSYSSRSRGIIPLDIETYLQQLGFQVEGSVIAQEVDGWILTRVAWIEKAL
jgi:SAM-dependent methyltransferase